MLCVSFSHFFNHFLEVIQIKHCNYFLHFIQPNVKLLDVIGIPVNEHRVGRNDGIYLLNEFNHFTPVIEPSVCIISNIWIASLL